MTFEPGDRVEWVGWGPIRTRRGTVVATRDRFAWIKDDEAVDPRDGLWSYHYSDLRKLTLLELLAEAAK